MQHRHENTRDKALAPVLAKLVGGHCSSYKAICEAYERGYSRGACFRKPEVISEKLQDLGNKLQIMSMLLARKREDNSIETEKLIAVSELMNDYYHSLTEILINNDQEDITNAK
jgi:hypothetical protein